MAFAKLRANVDEYAKDKWWQWHIPLWLFGAFVFYKMLGFNLTGSMPFVVAVPHAFDFMLHEFAHILTAWLPQIVTAAAGSVSELLLGIALVWGAFTMRNYFASLFCFLWLMLACLSVGAYMADAVPQQIPLVSLGGALAGSESTTHDWHYVFGQLGILGASGFIGGMFRVFGILAGLFGLGFSGWIIYKMAIAADSKAEAEEKSKAAALSAPTPPGKAPVYPAASRGDMADKQPPGPPA